MAKNDVIPFLILHSHFLVSIAMLYRSAFKNSASKTVLAIIALFYFITILASLSSAGDDFGFFHYFSMYLLAPSFVYFSKYMNESFKFGEYLLHVFILVLLYAGAGVVTFLFTLISIPMDFR